MTPCYLFRCPKCGGHIERIVAPGKEAEKARKKAPKCLVCKVPMKRHYGDIAIRFKGDGWSAPSKFPDEHGEEP